ncbi:hypothetical protein DJ568_02585 [Mucilaginibacter hurinus]|uniref:DUF4153 domain-containing protein n=1 Tax=Mucilaginibacter hurinus TaxID=2201324 RepID=A0A367GVD9_9SPHI|nr:DUF4153 domain-containing protein [Mucilaginibacter hurinus]RCH56761.1 hypothetical protein DJ568_02585 [Mucilaginibacter hurinus]
MKFPSVKILTESAAATVKRFPFEVLFALAGTIAAHINTNNNWHNRPEETWCFRVMMMANLGLLLSLSTTLFTESRLSGKTNKSWLLRGLVALLALMLLLVINPDERQFDYLRFLLFSLGFHLLVSFAAFTSGGNIHGFWQFNKTLFLRFLGGALYSIVLYLGLIAAVAATNFLFNLKLDSDIYMTVFVWIAGIFNTLFFLAGVPRDTAVLDKDESYPKGLKLFTQYVLIPLATVYVLILLSYEVKIAMEWRLPKGMVSNLILGYAVFGILSILLVYPIRNHEENKWIKTYARSFYILMIPLLVLLFLAVMARVLPYGITEERYFLLALASWLLFITAYFLLSRRQNIKVIPISLCVVSLLSVYGPQSAYSVSIYSQRKILTDIFARYGRYKDGKLLPLGDTKISARDGKEAYEKIEYLCDGENMAALQGYIDEDAKAVSDSLTKNIKEKRYSYRNEVEMRQVQWLSKYLGVNKFSTERFITNTTYTFGMANHSLIPIAGYDYAVKFGEYYSTAGDTMRVKNDRLTVVNYNVDSGHCKLSINGDIVKVNLNDVAMRLISQENTIKQYIKKSDYQTEYALPEEMLTVTRETADHIISIKIVKMSIDIQDDNVNSFYNTDGYYLIKKK